MGSTPSGTMGLGVSSRKPSPIRTPEGVARCHYRIAAPMALPGTATIWRRFSATWGRNCAYLPNAQRRSKTLSTSRASCTRSSRPLSALCWRMSWSSLTWTDRR